MRRLKEDNEKLQKKAKISVMEQQMQYEDLRSFCVKRHDYVLQLLEQI